MDGPPDPAPASRRSWGPSRGPVPPPRCRPGWAPPRRHPRWPAIQVAAVAIVVMSACQRAPSPPTAVEPQGSPRPPAAAAAKSLAPAQQAPAAAAPAAGEGRDNGPLAPKRPWWAADERGAPSPPDVQDVLIMVEAPLTDAAGLDGGLVPVSAGLRAVAGVETVLTWSEAGQARLLVRFGAGVDATRALARVDAALAATRASALGALRRVAIGRGARLVAAVTLVAAQGPLASRRWAETAVAPALAKVTGVHAVALAGAPRGVAHLSPQAPAMARYRVSLGDVQAALQQAQGLAAAATATSVSAWLAATTVPAPARSHGARTPPTLADVVVASDGVSAAPRAFVGRREVVLAMARGGASSDALAVGEALRREVAPLLRQPPAPDDESFAHSIGAMARYRLRADRPLDEPALDRLRGVLDAMVRQGQAVDALLVAGRDGIPCALDDACDRQQVWTLWLAHVGGRERDGALPELQASLEALGIRVHALADAWDTGVGWLLGEDATFAVLAAGTQATLVSRVARDVLARLQQSRDFGSLRTGPRVPPASAHSQLDPTLARQRGGDLAELSLVAALLRGDVAAGEVAGQRLRWSLGAGHLRDRVGELPLRAGDGTVPLQGLLRGSSERTTPLLRVDGAPALFVAADTARPETWVVVAALHAEVERAVEPATGLAVWTAVLGQRPLSPQGTP